MKIHTRYHGELDIEENDILHFKNGIPGFLSDTKFIMIPLGEHSPFSVLQSLDTVELAFVIANPFPFYKDYEFDVPVHLVEQLDIQNKEEVQVFCIVTLGEKIETSTVNLQAPLVLNSTKRSGKQLVLNTDKYTTKHALHLNKNEVAQEG